MRLLQLNRLQTVRAQTEGLRILCHQHPQLRIFPHSQLPENACRPAKRALASTKRRRVALEFGVRALDLGGLRVTDLNQEPDR